MKLPNGPYALVEIKKLRGYCLSADHPRGRHKARVFRSSLGLTATDSEELRAALLLAASEKEAVSGASDEYGSRYIIDFEMNRNELTARIRSAWIIPTGQLRPQFVTCFVL